MSLRVKDILESLNQDAPFILAESWDNVGLLVGNPDHEVTSVLIGLDPTNELIDEAIDIGANTVITHHPVIFKPLTTINTKKSDGRLLEKALSNRITIIGCHTNFDSAEEGVSSYLATQLGLKNQTPLIAAPDDSSPTGLGRIGHYETPVSAADFMANILSVLDLPAVQIAGELPKTISTVAVCGGSGSDFTETAFAQNADIYLSAEIKHSTAIWAVENNFCIIDGTHYATEKPAVALLVSNLQKTSDREGWKINILQTKKERPPFVYADKNYQP